MCLLFLNAYRTTYGIQLVETCFVSVIYLGSLSKSVFIGLVIFCEKLYLTCDNMHKSCTFCKFTT